MGGILAYCGRYWAQTPPRMVFRRSAQDALTGNVRMRWTTYSYNYDTNLCMYVKDDENFTIDRPNISPNVMCDVMVRCDLQAHGGGADREVVRGSRSPANQIAHAKNSNRLQGTFLEPNICLLCHFQVSPSNGLGCRGPPSPWQPRQGVKTAYQIVHVATSPADTFFV